MLHEVTPQDLVKFGLIPEFVGRVPVPCCVEGTGQGSTGADYEGAEECVD